MTKGLPPAKPRPPRPIADHPQGPPPGSPPDPCADEIELPVVLEQPVPVGTPLAVIVVGSDVVLTSGGLRIGRVLAPGDAQLRGCAERGWVHRGYLVTEGPAATVLLSGARP